MKLRQKFGILLALAVLAGGVIAVIKYQSIIDWWRLKDYTPPTAIAQLSRDSDFNDLGQRLFYVYYPELLDKADFQGKCNDNEITIVLGCYISRDKIYVLNVNNPLLDGVEEVTAAHEMLHAAYDRLSTSAKTNLNKQLIAAYETVKDARIRDTIASYQTRDVSIVPNELHSILGTEVRDLPKQLEDYYAQYFTDRLGVVTKSEAYANEFTKRDTQIKEYDLQLKELSTVISSKKTDIEQLSNALTNEKNQLNLLIDKPSVYNAAIPGFNAKVLDYNNRVGALKILINKYNGIVTQRNSIAAEEQQLVQSIDASFTEIK